MSVRSSTNVSPALSIPQALVLIGVGSCPHWRRRQVQVFREDTEPFALRRYSTTPRTKQSADKGNRAHEPLVKKSSVKKACEGKTKSDRRVLVLVLEENGLRKRPDTIDVGSPLFSDAEMNLNNGLPTENVPRSGFFRIFRLRLTVSPLFSVHDAFTTQRECRRLLEKMGTRASVPRFGDMALLNR